MVQKSFKFMLLATGLLLAFTGKSLLGFASTAMGGAETLATTETLAEVVIDNGTIGILNVKAVIDISRGKDFSSLVLIVDDPDFDKLVQINSQAGSKITVILGEPQITFSLLKSALEKRGILGYMVYRRDPIWILPQRYATDLTHYQQTYRD